MSLRSTYDRIAEDWHRDHQDDDWWVAGTDAFIDLLRPGQTVLDVGCGTGVKAGYLAKRGLRVTGVDLSEGMVAIARREHPEIPFFVEDLKYLERIEGSFDGVFAQAVLLHVPKQDVPEALGQLVGKLKPGGYLYLAVKERRPGGPEEETVTEEDYGYRYERFFSYFTSEELEGLVQEAGCEVVLNGIAAPKGRWVQLVGKKK